MACFPSTPSSKLRKVLENSPSPSVVQSAVRDAHVTSMDIRGPNQSDDSRGEKRKATELEEQKGKGESQVRRWNLRPRDLVSKKRVFDSSQEVKKGAKSMNKNQAGNDAVDETGKDEDDNDDTTHARFSLSLTRKEIQEDFLRITGSMPPKKPNKRTKPVQMALSAASPGGTLRSAKLEKYKVNKTRAKAKSDMLW